MNFRGELMSKAEETLIRLAEPVCRECGTYVYDAEYKKEGGSYYLRLYIDKDGGVGIDDCEKVSRALNPILDREDFIKEAYIFEVSSPGMDRLLSQPWHFEKVLGQDIDIKLFAPVDGKKTITGILISFDNNIITVSENGKETEIDKKLAASVRLAVKF